ncbi:MAG: UDP-N-acetylmuramate--alanine ligase [Paludibacteraceae bacterium]|nr:UDP-N-acetylmuramate--alanine ligase [Paludibacteraceae bacterium]
MSFPYQSLFFVGVAGTGMSAIAQYLAGKGLKISGSDRQFQQNDKTEIQQQLERAGIVCHKQDASGIGRHIDAVVVSTAIEESNVEYQKAQSLGIPVIKRSAVLAMISDEARTIAIGGTSGKSTTTAMIFHILQTCGKQPSLITGAGLSSLQRSGLIGNAFVGESDWLVIEADESDGSIVGYHPEIALLLNIERDHKEMDELLQLFGTFKSHTKRAFIVNRDQKESRSLSANAANDFACNDVTAGFKGDDFCQEGFCIRFKVNGIACQLPLIGRHNMENSLAAIAACVQAGVSIEDAVKALASFEGIYRRTQLIGRSQSNIYVIDDFAHNPSEVACAIKACQSVASKVVAYFQPHGFGPLRFMHKQLADDVAAVLRPSDVFIVGDVYYAGGTVTRDIQADVVSDRIAAQGGNALYGKDKDYSAQLISQQVAPNAVVLIMGARDPNLTDWARLILNQLL